MKRSWKKLAGVLLTGLMLMGLTGCGGEEAKNESKGTGEYAKLKTVELIGADSSGKGAAAQQFGELVAKNVDKITGGKLKIDYHPNSELGGDEDLLRQIKSNDIQIVVAQMAPLTAIIPETAVFDMPMSFAKYDGKTIDKVLNGNGEFHKKLSAAYEKAGLHYLGILQQGTFRLTTANKDLKTLDDFKGLKIRTMSNKNHMAFWSALGANPTPLAWPELYFALQSGTVDAEENAADTIVTANFNEVQKYVAETNHILYANQICINKQAYDSLDPAYQKALNQAVQDALKEMGPKLEKVDKDNKETLKKKGMILVTYDKSFYDQVLALPGVQALTKQINEQVGGLGELLTKELEAAGK